MAGGIRPGNFGAGSRHPGSSHSSQQQPAQASSSSSTISNHSAQQPQTHQQPQQPHSVNQIHAFNRFQPSAAVFHDHEYQFSSSIPSNQQSAWSNQDGIGHSTWNNFAPVSSASFQPHYINPSNSPLWNTYPIQTSQRNNNNPYSNPQKQDVAVQERNPHQSSLKVPEAQVFNSNTFEIPDSEIGAGTTNQNIERPSKHEREIQKERGESMSRSEDVYQLGYLLESIVKNAASEAVAKSIQQYLPNLARQQNQHKQRNENLNERKNPLELEQEKHLSADDHMPRSISYSEELADLNIAGLGLSESSAEIKQNDTTSLGISYSALTPTTQYSLERSGVRSPNSEKVLLYTQKRIERLEFENIQLRTALALQEDKTSKDASRFENLEKLVVSLSMKLESVEQKQSESKRNVAQTSELSECMNSMNCSIQSSEKKTALIQNEIEHLREEFESKIVQVESNVKSILEMTEELKSSLADVVLTPEAIVEPVVDSDVLHRKQHEKRDAGKVEADLSTLNRKVESMQSSLKQLNLKMKQLTSKYDSQIDEIEENSVIRDSAVEKMREQLEQMGRLKKLVEQNLRLQSSAEETVKNQASMITKHVCIAMREFTARKIMENNEFIDSALRQRCPDYAKSDSCCVLFPCAKAQLEKPRTESEPPENQ
uniref:Uncharacterized protein n=1 Tax=Timspurckia oligopyrenoides TaxID=708627 RepID=A0A7S0ZGL3_9RHOD|mmetsp:Transcript_4484/g.7861  ORF Transcript_4484/g.7861 Transcript_4484/m.7861 type:complete len:657 (+) Transcript_4484:123-2093(+)